MGEIGGYADATLLASYLARVDWARVGTLSTPRYTSDYLSAAAADQLPWDRFADAVPTLIRGTLPEATLDMVVVPKSLTWSTQDVNIYLGATDGPLTRSFLDLSESAFVAVFGWHIVVARTVSSALGCDVYVTHGFNPYDSSPDAHSVTAKFHTHLHVPDVHRRCPTVPAALSHFERLTLIEPYSVVLWDLARRWLAERSAVDTEMVARWRAAAGFGFVSITVPLDGGTMEDLRRLHGLLADAELKYLWFVEVFTDGQVESVTGHERCQPRPGVERHRRLANFESEHGAWLSTESRTVLRYLARNLGDAAPRDAPRSTRIVNARQAWIAKGFCGAINLVVSTAHDTLRVDIAPRVISTSGATKVISTAPTIIRKGVGTATPAERRRMHDFQQTVLAAVVSVPPIPA